MYFQLLQDGGNNHRIGVIINPANNEAVNTINKIILAAIRHNHNVETILKNADAIISGEKKVSDFNIQVCERTLIILDLLGFP